MIPFGPLNINYISLYTASKEDRYNSLPVPQTKPPATEKPRSRYVEAKSFKWDDLRDSQGVEFSGR